MYAALKTHRRLLTWLLLLLWAFSQPARGEEKSDGGGGGNQNEVPQFAPPPPIDTGSPGKMPERRKSTAMAKAMALGAMAWQMIACMKMMQEAQKAEGKDKAMMMMMAMMQCAQAAESAKNAAKNDENEKQMIEPAKGPTMKVPEFKMAGKSSGGDKLMKGLDKKPSDSQGEGDPTPPDPSEVGQPSIPDFVKTEGEAKAEPEEVAMGDLMVPVTSVPNRIDRAKLSYDESGKSGNNLTPDRALGANSSIATAKPGDNSKNGGTESARADGRGLSRGRGGRGIDNITAGGEGGSSGGGGPSDSDGAGSPLDAIMALLGGGGGPSEDGIPQVGADILTAREGGSSQPAPNIFEYAAFRYRKAAFEENKIKPRATKKTPTLQTGESAIAQAPKT